jgi:hypothetical protein
MHKTFTHPVNGKSTTLEFPDDQEMRVDGLMERVFSPDSVVAKAAMKEYTADESIVVIEIRLKGKYVPIQFALPGVRKGEFFMGEVHEASVDAFTRDLREVFTMEEGLLQQINALMLHEAIQDARRHAILVGFWWGPNRSHKADAVPPGLTSVPYVLGGEA